MWIPISALREITTKQIQILVLQKVIDRGQAIVYLEKIDNSKYWIAGLAALAVIAAFLIGKGMSSTETRTVEKQPETCPTTPYVSPTTGQPVQPQPAPR